MKNMSFAPIYKDDDTKNRIFETSHKTIAVIMLLAFTIPVVIMAFAFAKVQIWPGGKFTPFLYDMKAQFLPVISSLRNIGNSDHSIFLSFYGALGNNMLLNYLAYILDPSMWVTVLFSLDQLPTVIYCLTLFKIGICGVSASMYFFYGIKEKKYPFFILILSVCYALMSYNVMYSQCMIWYNVTALFPIILIGVERMIDGKKGGLYIGCLTLALYYNYQMSYMVGIFSVLYLIWRLSEKRINIKKTIFRFFISNSLCIGLFIPGFLPILYNVLGGRMQAQNYREGTLFYYPVWDVLKQFLSCRYDTIESGGLPLIFCGTLIPIIAVLAFVLPIRPILSRVVSAAIFVFFLASFCIVPLNQFWHGFNEPNSFPARYSFLFCFYLLILAYRVICFIYEKKNLSGPTVYALCCVVFLVTCTEMYLNAGFILTSLNIEDSYDISSMYNLQINGTSNLLEKIKDDDFFRIGRDLPYTHNDGMLFGYNGIGYFSSMFERNTMEFMKRLGYSQYEHTLKDSGGTPLTETIMGIRYKILWQPELFGYYESISRNGKWDLQYNKYALPLGFAIKYGKYDSDDRKELDEEINNHNSFAFQECILSDLRGERVHAYEKIKYEIEEVGSDEYERYVKMRFTATCDKPVWIYCRDEHDGKPVTAPMQSDQAESDNSGDEGSKDQQGSALLRVNGEARYPFVDSVSTLCMYLGTFKEGEEVEVEAACVNAFDDPWIVYYNEDECNLAFQAIKESGLKVTEHKNGVIKGTINITDDKDLMVLTLPSMRGYRIWVDGNRTDYGFYSNALLAFGVEPGEHTVEITYIPYGFIPGVVIGLICLFITVVYLKANTGDKRDHDPQQADEVGDHCDSVQDAGQT